MQSHRQGASGGGGHLPQRNNVNQGNPSPTEQRSRGGSKERPLRGVINTISGGFAGGEPSFAARKRHLRNIHSVNRADLTSKSMPPITFTDDDFHAPDPNHDDLMVITTIIARYSVGKVLVDQGSSTNILYWKRFQQMEVPDDRIMPFHE